MNILVKKHYKLHIFIFLLLSIQLFILTPVSFIQKILAMAVCIGVLFHIKKLKFTYRRWYEILIFIFVNVYLTMAFFGYDLFLVSRLYSDRFIRFFIFGLGFIWTSYVLKSFLDVLHSLGSIKDRLCSPACGGYWKKWFLLFTIMFGLFMIWQRAYNPIVMSPDSWVYLGGPYMLGRSIIYAFLNSIIIRLSPTSPAVEWIAITQIITFSCLLSTILMYFHKRWFRYKWIICAAIIIPMIPSFGLHTIVIWADLYVGITMLWLTYAIVRIIDETILSNTASKEQNLSLCIQICVSMVFLYFAKANTSVVYLTTAPVLAVFFIYEKQWKPLLSVVISVICVLLVRFPGYSALDASRDPNLDAHKYYAGIHDMQATYYNGGIFTENNLALLKKYIPNIDDIKDNFVSDWVIRGDWGNLQAIQESMTTGEFVSLYVATFFRNPFQMLRSMLFRNRAYWVIDPKEGINLVNYTAIYDPSVQTYIMQAPEINVYRRTNFLTSIMDKFISRMKLPIPATFVWRFGIWTALMVISIATLIWQKRYIWLIVYIPVFTHLATIFLTSGWTDYRYGLPIFFVGMFLPAALLLLNPASSSKEVST